MAPASLDRQIRAAYERLGALKQSFAESPATQQGAVLEALEELTVALRGIAVTAEADSRRYEELFQAEETLQRSHDALAGRVREGVADLAKADAALQTEIDQRLRTDAELAEQQAALAAVYRIATSTSQSYKAACDQVVLSLTRLLNVPCAAVRRADRRGLAMVSMAVDGNLSDDGVASAECGPCGIVCKEGAPHQCEGPLRQRFPDSQCFSDHDFRAYVGIPVKSSEGEVTGVLCAMGYEDRAFRESDIHLMEIFAQYVANEFERDAFERQLLDSERFQLLGQLTSGVAHEVRNPINAILIMTEALEARLGDGSEHAHYLGRIRAQVDRLSALMQDLLDLGKPLQLSRLERQSLAAICDAAAELWRQSMPDTKQVVRVAVPPGLFSVEVVADVARLTQVFINLIDNAAQHSPEDGEILLSVLPRDGDIARAQVIDRGCGIPAENLARVSTPFFTTRKSGTGLGLSLVKHMVEAHQGDVVIWNNDPPPGCTVEVRLPVAEETSP